MSTLTDRIRAWNTMRRARAAHTAALYGDYGPGYRLITHTTPHRLILTAAAWADAFLTANPRGEILLTTPSDQWVGQVIAARANRTPDVLARLVVGLPWDEAEGRMIALLREAAHARLDRDELDGPDSVWL